MKGTTVREDGTDSPNIGTMSTRYLLSYCQLHNIDINGYQLYEDPQLGSVYFARDGNTFLVFTTPNWDEVGVVSLEVTTDEGDCFPLGTIILVGNLDTQIKTYLAVMEGYLVNMESIVQDLVDSKLTWVY